MRESKPRMSLSLIRATRLRGFDRANSLSRHPPFPAPPVAVRVMRSGAQRPLPGVLLADEELAVEPTHMTIVGHKDDARAKSLHALARALPARYKRLEWLDLREGKLPNPDVEYPDLGEPAAFACSNRICSFPSFNAEELRATVAQMARLKPVRG
jgi:uncharacterized protein